MSYCVNSLKGVIYGILFWNISGVIKGDARSFDYSSYRHVLIAVSTQVLPKNSPNLLTKSKAFFISVYTTTFR